MKCVLRWTYVIWSNIALQYLQKARGLCLCEMEFCFCRPLFCHSSVVKCTSSLLQ